MASKVYPQLHRSAWIGLYAFLRSTSGAMYLVVQIMPRNVCRPLFKWVDELKSMMERWPPSRGMIIFFGLRDPLGWRWTRDAHQAFREM